MAGAVRYSSGYKNVGPWVKWPAHQTKYSTYNSSTQDAAYFMSYVNNVGGSDIFLGQYLIEINVKFFRRDILAGVGLDDTGLVGVTN